MLSTPTLCLIVALVPEFLPLKPPDSEPSTSSYFWVRFWLTMGAFVLAGVTEMDYCISDLNYHPWMLVLTAVIYSTVITAAYFALVPILGSPLPFSPVVLNFPVFAVIFTLVWVPLGPIQCMRRSVRRQLQLHIVTVSAKSSMAIVYPLFCYIFRVVDAKTQLPLTLLLPSVKLMEKLLMHYVTINLPDLQPLLITFNVEVFNTLFVSICLRSSTSLAVTALLMLMDFLSACISIYRLRDLMIHIDLLNAKLGVNVTREHMLDIAVFSITHFNADGTSTKSTRKSSVTPTNKTSVVAFNRAKYSPPAEETASKCRHSSSISAVCTWRYLAVACAV
ncbi:hypothetical protein DVH05_008318 [Phytophthora capsici]|nr:hypothetical protein DVH05_008318 [Phytophthora capsici]